MHAPSFLVLFAGALAGCSYHSTYIPPNDGRARLVWDGQGVVEYLPDGESTCVESVDKLRQGEGRGAMELSPHGRWWQPDDREIVEEPNPEPNAAEEWSDADYGGDSSASATRGQTRHHRHRDSHGGPRAVARASGSHGGRSFASPRIGRGGHGSSGKSSGGGKSGGGGGGGGKGAGGAAIALIVLVYAIMPVAAIVWAENPPESAGVSASIDSVHAYNDLARSGDADCGGER